MAWLPEVLPEPDIVALRGGPTLRWGVLGPGGIAARFTRALHDHTDQRVVAVGSRSGLRGAAFAALHGIPQVHDGYDGLVEDPQVDIVYVATPHAQHLEHALLAIDAGKHVLVEKPLAISAAQAHQLAAAARGAGVFAMEAMWTAFLPRVALVRTLVADGVLGTPTLLTADFGSRFDPPAGHRLLDPAQGGGALLDVGIYPIAFAVGLLGAPTGVTAAGALTESGVDAHAALVLEHGPAGEHGPALSLLATAHDTDTPRRATVAGTEARAELDAPFYAPGDLVLMAGEQVRRWDDRSGVRGLGGLAYQATAVAADIAAGARSSAVHPLRRSIEVLEVIDSAREALAASDR